MNIMENIGFKLISYNDIKEKLPIVENDNYGLFKKYTETRRKTFLANPFLNDYSEIACYLKSFDDIIVGRCMGYPTELILNGSNFQTRSGSTLDVVEEYRKYCIGIDLMTLADYPMTYDLRLSAGISPIALPLYKKLKYSIFEFPRLLLIKNSFPILKSKGISWLSPLVNIVLKSIQTISLRVRKNKFYIEQVTYVPDWVGELATNDGHKYMENHNREWLQWNLDYNFKGDPRDIQKLFIVKNGEENLGFIMIKERWRDNAGGLKDLTLGSIVEWGTFDEKTLSEADLILMVLTKFNKHVDLIEFASDNPKTLKKMKWYGFIPFGYAHIAFKDKKKRFQDASDQKNWRLRLGYADVILT